nr:uncharacterized protein LOC129279708 [Lytechinus pictus]
MVRLHFTTRLVILWFGTCWFGLGVHALVGCLHEGDDEVNGLSFLHETSPLVFSTECEYRVLQCRSINFCRIRWFFNGIPYDSWSLGEESDTKYRLEDHNQTIRFHSTDVDAEGTFTCVVSNGLRNITRSIDLKVQEGIWLNMPTPYQSSSLVCKNQTALLGGNASFFCQFRYRSPGAFLQHSWRKFNDTIQEYELVDFYNAPGTEFSEGSSKDDEITTQRKKCPGKPPKILSTWLNITNVTEEALGMYQVRCRIAQFVTKVNLTLSLATTEEPLVVTNTSTVVILVVTMIIVVLLFMLSWKRYGTDIKLLFHDQHAKLETEEIDDKLYDAYIVSCYEGEDRSFVENILCPSLTDHYKLYIHERDKLFGSVESEEIIEAMTKSRRCIVVLSTDFYMQSSTSSSQSTSASNPSSSTSPSSSVKLSDDSISENQWHLFELHYALDTMHPHLIPLLYRDSGPTSLSNTDSNAELINHVLSDVECIKWKQKGKTRLDDWAMKQLRLRLPPRRRGSEFSRGQSLRITMPSSLSSMTCPSPLDTRCNVNLNPHDLRLAGTETSCRDEKESPSSSGHNQSSQRSQLSSMPSATSPSSSSSPMSLSFSSGFESCPASSLSHRSPTSKSSLSSRKSSQSSSPAHSSTHSIHEFEPDNLNSFQEYGSNPNRFNSSLSVFKFLPRSKKEPYLIDNETKPGYI